jgi:hypothetical protein
MLDKFRIHTIGHWSLHLTLTGNQGCSGTDWEEKVHPPVSEADEDAQVKKQLPFGPS